MRPRYIDANKAKIELDDYYSHISAIAKRQSIKSRFAAIRLDCKAVIDACPTADVRENRHGHWIRVAGPDRAGNAEYRCSECSASDDHAVAVIVPFCWRCGAEMALDYVEVDLEDEDDQ